MDSYQGQAHRTVASEAGVMLWTLCMCTGLTVGGKIDVATMISKTMHSDIVRRGHLS